MLVMDKRDEVRLKLVVCQLHTYTVYTAIQNCQTLVICDHEFTERVAHELRKYRLIDEFNL